jgi:twitching motility protein PilI
LNIVTMESVTSGREMATAQPYLPLPAMTPFQALTAGFAMPLAEHASAAAVPAARRAAADATQVELRQGISIGELKLMIRYQDGSELTDLPVVFRLPNAPSWFHGMANLHGALIPVFGLREYLGLREKPVAAGAASVQRMMLVMGSGADAAGVVIDGLPQRLRFQQEHRADDAPVPAGLQAHVSATYLIGDHLHFDLESSSLLDAMERALAPPQ